MRSNVRIVLTSPTPNTDTTDAQNVMSLEQVVSDVTPTTGEATEEANKEEEETLVVPQTYLQDATAQSRFSGAEWIEDIKSIGVTIIGAGGIGSWTTLGLARTGIGNIFQFDGDIIENHNMAGQLYRISDVGQYKTDACREIVKSYVPTVKGGFFGQFYQNEDLEKVTIAALDSMKARKMVFANFKKQHEGKEGALFIDGRMTADAFQVFVVRATNKAQMKMYENNCLFDDDLAAPLPCSYKATSFVGMMIGGFITAVVKEHVHLHSDEMFCNNVKFYNEIDTSLGVVCKQTKTWSYK